MVKSWFGQASTKNNVFSTRCFSYQANEGKVFIPLLSTPPLQLLLSSFSTYIQQRHALANLSSTMTFSAFNAGFIFLKLRALEVRELLLTAMPVGEKKIANRLFVNQSRLFSSSHYSWPYMV